jgi:hypothetical protein
VEPAKTTALEKLGEGEQAQGIAMGWLRPKLLLAMPAWSMPIVTIAGPPSRG